ncbi:hypothetical protein W97_04386 [Coniosporium apollinis CBS 100218]|uniref:NAD dependent epimerase/dehydratase n=1 Tax=Coniosporium apollinis (strain CBS 100218) TaxID=1168221 RepID=R7YTL9_CONA1|nr:uncharacterized protein W97_04386 [Coniosporium apollinis CBS 100218]EON65149.1 hypothetical protein W97_04386 [Coniosporium apollinis CBS 100218]
MAFRPGQAYTPRPVTDIFTPDDTEIDRRKCRRTVPMRVLALGLGRTGTASLRAALKELGFDDCYHMMSASVENPPDCLMWQDALAAKYDGIGTFGRTEWDKLFGHCQAVCDWPCVAFAQELTEAYPDAKVILTTRDVDSWHASCLKTVDWRANDPELVLVAKLGDWAAALYQPMLHKFWACFFRGDFRKHGKQVFTEYYAEVRSLVPPEKLLNYSVSEGWGPLCDFLEVPVPENKEFPHSNDTEKFVTRCRKRNHDQLKNVLFRYLVYGSGVAATVLASSLAMRHSGVLLGSVANNLGAIRA